MLNKLSQAHDRHPLWFLDSELFQVEHVLNRIQDLVIDILLAPVAPDTQIAEADRHQVILLYPMEKHVFGDVAAAVDLVTSEAQPVLPHVLRAVATGSFQMTDDTGRLK